MKLGCVTTSYPRFAGDLAGHFVARHVQELRRRGHRVEVIAAGADEAAGAAEADEPDEPPIIRVASPLFFRGGAPEALSQLTLRRGLSALTASARFALAAAPRARRWDATVAHWLAPSALAALPARGPLLAIAHGGDLHLLRRTGLLAPALALLLARRARLAFVSDELRRLARAASPARWRERFDELSIVQPMGVDLAEFGALPAASPHPRRYLLVLARLVPIKGVDLALRAFAQLVRHDLGHDLGLGLDLVIAGDGPERAALRALAASLPCAPRVHFLGAIPTHARAAWLGHATAVLLPSRRLPDGRGEGMPQVALEALAAGAPLLAAAVGGLAELPAPARLLDVSAGPHRWADALADLLAAPPTRAELRALAAPHAWPRVVDRLTKHWQLAHP